ncbi:AAA family ATPase [Oceanobacter kriegii]|uniref:AAA family ATPase n=1 Tax=Oceanobacter kriegii TaxID=64972 RepID=UPI000411E9AF|nr:AAA family ATPase [Oceanobacter kriegii]
MDGTHNASAQTDILLIDSRFRYCLDTLQRMLTSGLGPACIHGEWGAGKSTLLRALESRLSRDGHLVVVVNDASLSSHSVLLDICQRLGIACPDVQQTDLVLSRIAEALIRNAPQQRMMLLVDDADTLSSRSWELVFRLAFSDPNGEQLLPAVFTTEAPLADYPWQFQGTIGGYSRAGFRRFVAELAMQKGGAIAFADDSLDMIYDYSSGFPGSFYALCSQCLAAAEWHGRTIVDTSMVESVVSATQQQQPATQYQSIDDDDEDEPEPQGWFDRILSWADGHPVGSKRIAGAVAAMLVLAVVVNYTTSETRLIVAPDLVKSLETRQAKPAENSMQLFEAERVMEQNPPAASHNSKQAAPAASEEATNSAAAAPSDPTLWQRIHFLLFGTTAQSQHDADSEQLAAASGNDASEEAMTVMKSEDLAVKLAEPSRQEPRENPAENFDLSAVE